MHATMADLARALPSPRLRNRIVGEARTLAVELEAAELALAAERLERAGDDLEAVATCLLELYGRAAAIGKRRARYHRGYEGAVDESFCEALRPELEQAHRLEALVLRALEAIGRAPEPEG